MLLLSTKRIMSSPSLSIIRGDVDRLSQTSYLTKNENFVTGEMAQLLGTHANLAGKLVFGFQHPCWVPHNRLEL